MRVSDGAAAPVLVTSQTVNSADQHDRIRAEQIRMLYRSGPIGVLVAGIGAFMISGMVLYLGAIPEGVIRV